MPVVLGRTDAVGEVPAVSSSLYVGSSRTSVPAC